MKKVAFAFSLCVMIGLGFVFSKKYNSGLRDPASYVGPKPASALVGANAEQQDIIDNLTEITVSIKKREGVLAAVDEIKRIASEPKHRNYPAVQMYGAVADVVPLFEGIVYRCRDLIEKSDWLNMTALFRLRAFAYNDYVYGEHMKAITDFLTYPSERVGKPFKTVSELQDFLLNKVAVKMESALAVAKKLEALPSQDFQFQLDRTIIVGRSNNLRFIDADEAKKDFIKPYFFTVSFLLQRVIGSIYYMSAMNLDDMPKVVNKILKKTAMNGFIGDLRADGRTVRGITPQLLTESIESYPSYMTWKTEVNYRGSKLTAGMLLDRAFEYGRSSANYQRAAYVCGLKYPLDLEKGDQSAEVSLETCKTLDVAEVGSYHINNGEDYLFNPNSMILNFKQKNKMFQDRVRVFEGAAKNSYVKVVSDSTGKSIEVNARAFFNTKKSQRDFLPTSFEGSPSTSVESLNTYAWNYSHGRPASYNDYTFNGFFNPKEVGNMKTLYANMTTLMYTDSISPFAGFIRVPSPLRVITFSEFINANN